MTGTTILVVAWLSVFFISAGATGLILSVKLYQTFNSLEGRIITAIMLLLSVVCFVTSVILAVAII